MTKTATKPEAKATNKKADAPTKDKEIHDDTTKTDATVPMVKTPISVTRLKHIAAKVEATNRTFAEALEGCNVLLFGKDESTSSLVVKVREIRDLILTAQPALAEAPGKVAAAIAEREEIL